MQSKNDKDFFNSYKLFIILNPTFKIAPYKIENYFKTESKSSIDTSIVPLTF